MELLNEISSYKQKVIDTDNISSESHKIFKETIINTALMLSPFTPHFADEIWEICGKNTYTFNEEWPKYIEKLTVNSDVTVAVQVNGKLRAELNISRDLSKEEIEKLALENEKIKNMLAGKEIVKIIVVPNKIVNIVIK